MKGAPPPLRFLLSVVGGWLCLRAAALAPSWPSPPPSSPPITPSARPLLAGQRFADDRPLPVSFPLSAAALKRSPMPRRRHVAPPKVPAARRAVPPSAPTRLAVRAAFPPFAEAPAAPASPRSLAEGAARRRWTLSAWLFAREGGGRESLAAGGMLGGSQAGLRALLPLRGGLSLAIRVSAPEAEAAPGLDWRPSQRLPLHLLAERRQALGRGGRSAFALAAYAGVSDAPLGAFRLDAYGQAGAVGRRRRALFADGGARLSWPLGPAKLGAGLWGAAQPGASRLDAGPQAALAIPFNGRRLTVAADWRVRVAGRARPGSGPALTLATDF